MLTYQFSCNDCENDQGADDKVLNADDNKNGYHPRTGDFIFYVKSKMSNVPKHPKCPRCGRNNTNRNYLDNKLHCWVRGNGIVNDKAGARRDMNKYTLMTNDPYGHMRQSGEVDDMIKKCENAGRNMAAVRRRNKVKITKKKAFKTLPTYQHELLMKISEFEFGCPYQELYEFEDVNKTLSELMPDYICKTKNDIFKLMAQGRYYVDRYENKAEE